MAGSDVSWRIQRPDLAPNYFNPMTGYAASSAIINTQTSDGHAVVTPRQLATPFRSYLGYRHHEASNGSWKYALKRTDPGTSAVQVPESELLPELAYGYAESNKTMRFADKQTGSLFRWRESCLKYLMIFVVFLMIQLPNPALSQAVGRVVAVTQLAQAENGAQVIGLSEGSEVESGNIIKTDKTGEAQIVFLDDTKIIISRNSELVIDQTLFKTEGTAKKFATKALGGTFRFISGDSPKRVYKIATPLATMGIRGTEFDVAVGARGNTALLVFGGKVRFCNLRGICVTVPGGCHAVTIDGPGRFSQPRTNAEKAALLKDRFPLVSEQERLRPEFRVATDGCESANLIALPNENESDRPDSGQQGDRGGDPGGNPAE